MWAVSPEIISKNSLAILDTRNFNEKRNVQNRAGIASVFETVGTGETRVFPIGADELEGVIFKEFSDPDT